MVKHAGGWGGTIGEVLEATKPARSADRRSVPWGRRNPDSQAAGLGLDTCCLGDHLDAILVQGAPALAGLHAQDQVLPHKLTEPLLIGQLPGRLPGPSEAPKSLLQLLLLHLTSLLHARLRLLLLLEQAPDSGHSPQMLHL